MFEVAVHIISPDENPWLGPPFAKSKVRIPNPLYGHTLHPNFEGEEVWGSARTKIITNSLGFKSASKGDVPLRPGKRRLLFLGDSFTEGVGVPYEESFVGRFAAAVPQLDVLNGAVSSYAPSVYYAKTKYLLDSGFHLDEVIVYIDISDVQDEAVGYRTAPNGELEEGHFDSRCLPASAIVEGGIAKAIAEMDKLHALLSEKHIALSVGIYPWPQQLLYDKEESRQVTIWRDWCENKCRRFIITSRLCSLTNASTRTFSAGCFFGETMTTTRSATRSSRATSSPNTPDSRMRKIGPGRLA